MFVAHLPAGYLAGRIVSCERRSGRWWCAALVGSVFPDLDMLYFYLIDGQQSLHHHYWTHLPFVWLCLTPILALHPVSRIFVLNVFGHLVLDTVAGGILWLWPWHPASFVLFQVPGGLRVVGVELRLPLDLRNRASPDRSRGCGDLLTPKASHPHRRGSRASRSSPQSPARVIRTKPPLRVGTDRGCLVGLDLRWRNTMAPKIDGAVLNAVAHALSNDRFPVDGIGFKISKADQKKIIQTVTDEIVRGASDGSITAAINVFARGYEGADNKDLTDWAAKNHEFLDDLSSRIPHMRSQIGAGSAGGMADAKAFAKKVEPFAWIINLAPSEDGPDSSVAYKFIPEAAGGDEAAIKKAFGGADYEIEDGDEGEFLYEKGDKAVDAYLENVVFEVDYADDPSTVTEKKFLSLLKDPNIKEVHFVGSWSGADWGTSGGATWSLILEYASGHFVSLETSGGWQ